MKLLPEVMRHRTLAIVLWTALIVSAVLMVKSSSNELIPLLQGTATEPIFSQFKTGNQIIFDISVGIIVSLLIYVLVVWLPERFKQNRIRRNLQHQYSSFKEECIKVFLWALHQTYDPELINRLKNRNEFRRFFKEKVLLDRERWHAVLNGLDEYMVKNLIVDLEILKAEIQFTLSAIERRKARSVRLPEAMRISGLSS